MSEIAEALRQHISSGQKVQIDRGAFDHPHWNGYPLAASDRLVLVRTLDDFDLDGFAVLRMEDLTAVRSGEPERFFDHVLRAEGLLDAVPPAPSIRLDGWQSVLEDVLRGPGHAIIECEGLEDPEFYLGRLVDVDAERVALRYITVTGLVEEEITHVPLEDITLVRFDERYVRYFAKYAKDERALH